MKKKCTDGSWTFTSWTFTDEKWGPRRIFELYDSDGRMMCSSSCRGSTTYDPLTDEELKMNFLKMAAVPELLEACEMALPLIRSEPYCEDSPESECSLCDTRKRVEDCLRAAIAKARGEG